MTNPNSRQTLIDYCLRRLGAPVIEINLDEDQIEDRVDEALQFYQTYHSDAILPTYIKHIITEFDTANKYIDIGDHYTYIRRVLPLDTTGSSISMFDARYQIRLNDVYDMSSGIMGNLTSYFQMQQYLGTLDIVLNGTEEYIRFSRHMNRLYMDTDWSQIKVGTYIIIDCDMVIDPQTYTDVYNDMWLKRYTTALIKRQWGANLIKFEGVQLPGGVILNGRQIFDDAMTDIQDLEEELRLNFELPVNFMVG